MKNITLIFATLFSLCSFANEKLHPQMIKDSIARQVLGEKYSQLISLRGEQSCYDSFEKVDANIEQLYSMCWADLRDVVELGTKPETTSSYEMVRYAKVLSNGLNVDEKTCAQRTEGMYFYLDIFGNGTCAPASESVHYCLELSRLSNCMNKFAEHI